MSSCPTPPPSPRPRRDLRPPWRDGRLSLDPIEDAAATAAPERFMKIYLWNEAHIRSCDALVAI
ncbi:hypothetical protein ACFQU7_08180 [Pseudoroseomonas wenyumeiae]